MPIGETHLPATTSRSRSTASRSRSSGGRRACRPRSRRSSTGRTRRRGCRCSRSCPGRGSTATSRSSVAAPTPRTSGTGSRRCRTARSTTARKNGSVVLYDYEGTERSRFNFVNAWPSKVSARLAAGRRQRRAARGVHDHARRNRARMSAVDRPEAGRRRQTCSARSSPSSCRGATSTMTARFTEPGVMRLATARDEILPLRDPRVRENESYLTVLLLSRVITELGSLGEAEVTPGVDREAVRFRPGIPPGPLPTRQPGGAHARRRVAARIAGASSRST